MMDYDDVTLKEAEDVFTCLRMGHTAFDMFDVMRKADSDPGRRPPLCEQLGGLLADALDQLWKERQELRELVEKRSIPRCGECNSYAADELRDAVLAKLGEMRR